MARVTHLFTDFSAGELSPKVSSRTDLKLYDRGCQTLENFYVMTQGGAQKRQGTEYIATAHNSVKSVRLIPFIYSEEQAYILEFGEYYVRFFSDGGIVLDTETSQPYVITSPYASTELDAIRLVQSADVMYLTHPDHEPYELLRYGHDDWDLNKVNFYGGPFLTENSYEEITMTPTAIEGAITLTVDEQMDNGDFDTDLTDWTTVERGGGRVRRSASAKMTVMGDGSTWSQGEQKHVTDPSYDYTLTFDISGADMKLSLNSEEEETKGFYSKICSGGSHTISFAPSSDDVYVSFMNDATSGSAVDNVSLKPEVFNEFHEGAYWRIAGTERIEEDIDAENTFTDSIQVDAGASFIFSLSDTWVGTVTLQKSYDKGTTWLDYYTATSNTSVEITEVGDGVYFRAGFKTGDYTSGTANMLLSKLDQYGYIEINKFTDEYEVSGRSKKKLPSTTSTYRWSEGAWSEFRGFPSSIAFFEQRLLYASNTWFPQTLWGSQVDDYDNFNAGTGQDSESYSYTLASSQLNTIQWMLDKKVLIAGSFSGEWKFGDVDEPTTPTSVDAKRQTTYGSAGVQAIPIGHHIIYVQQGKTKVRAMGWDYQIESWQSPDISVLAEHMLEPGVKALAYAGRPDPLILMTTDDGDIACCLYEPANKMNSFSKWTIDGEYESVAVIPGDDRDEIWVSVKRNIDGNDVIYIERFATSLWTDKADAYFSDSALQYKGIPKLVLSGLDHLEGKELALLVNGAVHPNRTVESGTITLQVSGSNVIGGLPFTAALETMQINQGAEMGTSQGRRMNLFEIGVRIYRTLGLSVGFEEDGVDIIPFRSSADPMDSSPPLFTGDKYQQFKRGWSRGQSVYVKSYQPLPCSILGLIVTTKTTDK